MIGGPVSETLVRFTALATVAACSMAAVFATVTPGSSQMRVFATSSGPAGCCTSVDLTVSNPSGSLNPLKKSVAGGCQCSTLTTDAKAKGVVSWKHPYEGSATAQINSKFTQSSTQGQAGFSNDWSYSFTTDGPYQLTVECGLSGDATWPNTDNGIIVQIDNMFVCDAYIATGVPPSNTGSKALGPGNHTLSASHFLSVIPPPQQTGSANQNSSVKWRLDGCESRKEVQVSNHPFGIVGDFSCQRGEPANLKDQWVDEQGEQFRLTCENSSFHLRYHPNGTDPLPAATCVWRGGENNANIFVPGDTDNDGEYDCFIRSTWINREPEVDQGVPNLKDRCLFNFDVKTGKLKIEHQVLDVLDHAYRPLLPSELAAGDRCVAGLSLASAVVGDVGGDAGGVLLCDQYVDGVCDALDNMVLVNAIGASVGDPGYDFLLDLNDDGLVLDDDLRALFPDLDLEGDSVPNSIDNCLAISNSSQTDTDSDGHGDACDCAPSNATAFAVPLEIIGLSLSDGSLSWDSDAPHSGSSAEYDVLSGVLSELPVGGGVSERCLTAATPITIANDTLDPAPGTGFYYLIRGRNPCGTGTYGRTSSGTSRVSSTCPGN